MSSNRQMLFAVMGLVGCVALALGLLIWPNYREAASLRHQAHDLQTKIDSLGDENVEVERLVEQVSAARKQVAANFKVIPESPDVAEMIRKLSLGVDGRTVMDQTFTAGTPDDALPAQKATMRYMPLKVDMRATFESIFALMRSAESMKRLVRIATVKVACKRDDKQSEDRPMLEASVGLEVLFDAPAAEAKP
jgi:Tfp pilus assembly protein PilO